MTVITYGGGDTTRDVLAHPFLQYDGGATQTIVAGAITAVTLASSVLTSTPYATSVTLPGSGVIVLPLSGVWSIGLYGTWQNVLDSGARIVIVQLSIDNGANFNTLWADGRPGLGNASYGENVTFSCPAYFLAGYQLRYVVLHAASTSITWMPGRFNATYQRGAP